MVWYGVVWYGVVWCGAMWRGVAWRDGVGVVWCDVVWCVVVWCGVVWCVVVCGGVVWCGVVWCGVVWHGIFIFHRQYNVISKKNSKLKFDIGSTTTNERRAPYNPKVVLPQLLFWKRNTIQYNAMQRNATQRNTTQYNIVYFQPSKQLHHNSHVYPNIGMHGWKGGGQKNNLIVVHPHH